MKPFSLFKNRKPRPGAAPSEPRQAQPRRRSRTRQPGGTPGWVKLYDTAPETRWAAVRNPALDDLKTRRKARWKVRGMLAAVPVSVVALAVALGSAGQNTPILADPSPQPRGAARAETAALVLAAQWRLPVEAVVWTGWRSSSMPCSRAMCEVHELDILETGPGGQMRTRRLELTIDPDTGAYTGATFLPDGGPLPGAAEGASWQGRYPDFAASLTAQMRTAVTDWAEAWVSGDQTALERLAGTPGPHPWSGESGWFLTGAVRVLSAVAATAEAPVWVTVEFVMTPGAAPGCDIAEPAGCGPLVEQKLNVTVTRDGVPRVTGPYAVGDLDAPETGPALQ